MRRLQLLRACADALILLSVGLSGVVLVVLRLKSVEDVYIDERKTSKSICYAKPRITIPPRTNARMGRVDRNWAKSGGRLFSYGRGGHYWERLRESHTTRKIDFPSGYLHRTRSSGIMSGRRTHAYVYHGSLGCCGTNGDRRQGKLAQSLPRES